MLQKIRANIGNSTPLQIAVLAFAFALGCLIFSVLYIPFQNFMLPSKERLQSVSGIVEQITYHTKIPKDLEEGLTYRRPMPKNPDDGSIGDIFGVKIKKPDGLSIILYLPRYDISEYRISPISQKPVTFRFANVKDVYEIEVENQKILVYETVVRGRISDTKIKGITWIIMSVILLLLSFWWLRRTLAKL